MAANRAETAHALLFVPGDGAFQRLNPLTKLMALLWMISASIAFPPNARLVLILAALAYAAFIGIGATVVKRFLITIVPFTIALGVMHGFLIVRPDEVPLGPVHYSPAGLAYAYGILSRLAGVVAGSLLFVTTTHPGDMLKSLDARGFSPAIGYLIASPLLLLEPFSQRARGIRDAQRARGMDLTGSLRARVAALPALLVPLITLALSDLDHRVMVLEGRAFRAEPRRTVLDAPADGTAQRWARRALGTTAVLQLGALAVWH
jgi:energy-coupling factor transport system permease protein